MNPTVITIPGFDKLTKQQLFDMSSAHILTTRVQCRNGVGNCSYQGPGCAAAPFIQPAYRERADERGSWHALRELRGTHEAEFVGVLQQCHDGIASGEDFMDNWKRLMRYVAEQYFLSTALIDNDKE